MLSGTRCRHDPKNEKGIVNFDISHAVGVIREFLANLDKTHWEPTKWVFRYLRGTSKLLRK